MKKLVSNNRWLTTLAGFMFVVLFLVGGMAFTGEQPGDCGSSLDQAEAALAELSPQDQQAIIDRVVSYQTEGEIYHADDYRVIKLEVGDIIYGMLPGQSVFYTDQSTVDQGSGSYQTLYQLLQIRPHPVFGYRTRLGVYEVLQTMYVASGRCLANREIIIDGHLEILGDGGGIQYVIFDYEDRLRLLEELDLDD